MSAVASDEIAHYPKLIHLNDELSCCALSVSRCMCVCVYIRCQHPNVILCHFPMNIPAFALCLDLEQMNEFVLFAFHVAFQTRLALEGILTDSFTIWNLAD